MATLVAQAVASAGLKAVPVNADAGTDGNDTFANTGKECLLVANASGGPINVTIAGVGKCDQGVLHDLVVAIPDGESRYIGPFNSRRFGATPEVTYSDTTTVTVALLQFNAA